MQVPVRYFAAIREQVGTEAETVELADGATAADLLARLQALHPESAGLLGYSRVAQDNAFLPGATSLLPDVPADVIPPVSGG